MAEKTSGVWIDKDTGKIVNKAPTRGRQLVAPGHEVTKEAQEVIDRYAADYATNFGELAEAPTEGRPIQSSDMTTETARSTERVDPKTVTTGVVKKAPARR